jgi:hypothetical protein
VSTGTGLIAMKSDRWVLLIIVLVIAGLGFGFYFLFNWADQQSPWILRVVVVLLATSIGYRIGREIRQTRKNLTWLPIALALAGLLLSGWFGMIRPALRDRDFAAFIAEGRATTEALEAVAAETREAADAKEPMGFRLHERNVDVVRRMIDWLDHRQAEAGRYSVRQQRELDDEALRMMNASAVSRDVLARWATGKGE